MMKTFIDVRTYHGLGTFKQESTLDYSVSYGLDRGRI